MSLNIIGTYNFSVQGDDVTSEILIPLRALEAPDPISTQRDQPYIPTALISATINPPQSGAPISITTFELYGDLLDQLHLVFSAPPPSRSALAISVVARFGTQRI